MAKTGSEKPKVGQEGVEALKRVRLLLLLWSMNGLDAPVSKAKLTDSIKGSGKASDYKNVFEELEQQGAIAITGREVRLSAQGLKQLGKELKDSTVEFPSQVGVKTANALLRWIREMSGVAIVQETNGNGSKRIDSYSDFEKVVMGVYEQLKQDYNLDQLVPIYRMRREIGERVTRPQFDEWLLEMQANDRFQLIGGEMPDLTTDKANDSVKTALGGVRYYAKAL